jgi:hypothetical protein
MAELFEYVPEPPGVLPLAVQEKLMLIGLAFALDTAPRNNAAAPTEKTHFKYFIIWLQGESVFRVTAV